MSSYSGRLSERYHRNHHHHMNHKPARPERKNQVVKSSNSSAPKIRIVPVEKAINTLAVLQLQVCVIQLNWVAEKSPISSLNFRLDSPTKNDTQLFFILGLIAYSALTALMKKPIAQ